MEEINVMSQNWTFFLLVLNIFSFEFPTIYILISLIIFLNLIYTRWFLKKLEAEFEFMICN